MLFMIGPKIFAKRCALSESRKSCSFSTSKSRSAAFSWQNTLTTFWPFIISSMKPSVLPRDSCCRTKKVADFPPTRLVAHVMAITPSSTTAISGTLK